MGCSSVGRHRSRLAERLEHGGPGLGMKVRADTGAKKELLPSPGGHIEARKVLQFPGNSSLSPIQAEGSTGWAEPSVGTCFAH